MTAEEKAAEASWGSLPAERGNDKPLASWSWPPKQTKHCAFCSYASDDPNAFRAHVQRVHNWTPPPEAKTAGTARTIFYVLLSSGLSLFGATGGRHGLDDVRVDGALVLFVSGVVLWFARLRKPAARRDARASGETLHRRFPTSAAIFVGIGVLTFIGLYVAEGPHADALVTEFIALAVAVGAWLVWIVPRALVARWRSRRPLDQRDAIWAGFALLVCGYLVWSVW